MNLHFFEDNSFANEFVNKIESIIPFSRYQSVLDAHDIEILIKFQVLFGFYFCKIVPQYNPNKT